MCLMWDHMSQHDSCTQQARVGLLEELVHAHLLLSQCVPLLPAGLTMAFPLQLPSNNTMPGCASTASSGPARGQWLSHGPIGISRCPGPACQPAQNKLQWQSVLGLGLLLMATGSVRDAGP